MFLLYYRQNSKKEKSVAKKSLFSEYDLDKVEEFEWWFWDNLEQYKVIQDCVTAYGKEAKKKFSLRTVLENLRAGLTSEYRHINISLNNDFIPMLQRKLESDRPDLSVYLTAVRGNHKKVSK
jgi:hypothetical protein